MNEIFFLFAESLWRHQIVFCYQIRFEGKTTRVECPIFSQELYDVKWSCFWLHKKSTNNNFYTIVGYYRTFEEHDGPLINLMFIAVCISFLG